MDLEGVAVKMMGALARPLEPDMYWLDPLFSLRESFQIIDDTVFWDLHQVVRQRMKQ